MSWFQAAASAASSFVQETALKVQETIQQERSEFLDEYARCRRSAETDQLVPGSTRSTAQPGLKQSDRNLQEALDTAKRMGAALFNPFEDQVDSSQND